MAARHTAAGTRHYTSKVVSSRARQSTGPSRSDSFGGLDKCGLRTVPTADWTPDYNVLPASIDPGLRDEQLLEEADGVAVGHAGEKVAGGGVEPFRLDRPPVEELVGPLADLLPQPAEDARRPS